ncbi:glutathione S-transferase family protein [Thalassobius sp. MITS945101]|uniref:glutathione S-transferase family protein n=1 Tax=Thalassobius sp. MITS945101 TaxID=3096994 RepID=UPI00399A17D2
MYQVIGGVSSRAFRVIWMLEELGEEFEVLTVKPHSPEAKAANPSGKIPALRVDGNCITDSNAILTYLADKHGALTYAPGTLPRARQDALHHQVLDELDAILWTAARHSFILPEDQRVPAVKDSLKQEYLRNTARLVAEIEGPFLMGDQITIADIVLTHCLNWAHVARFPKPDDRLTAYAKEMRAREAFQRALKR